MPRDGFAEPPVGGVWRAWDVPSEARNLFVHPAKAQVRDDSGIIGTLRERRKEESWRFPTNGSIGWTAGRPRCKVFSAAATSSRAQRFAPPAVRWWESTPRAATSAAPT